MFFGTFIDLLFILQSIVMQSTFSFLPLAERLTNKAEATIKNLVDFIASQSQKKFRLKLYLSVFD
jgi:hypothetical protein